MKTFCLLFFLFFTLLAPAQKVIKGVVLDGDKRQPLPGASVFLNNTSVGTTANAQGNFELTIPKGKFDLIISSIGFETFNQTINSEEIDKALTILLKPKAKELDNVVIEPYEKDGWAKWGDFFTQLFIGTSGLAPDCIIKNASEIRFRNVKKTNELIVSANEPIIIENKALGYTLRYQLEGFTYQFKTRYLFYYGYPFFEEMDGNAARKKRWQTKREEVYFGSMLHFMRAVYRNTIIEEGFQVRHLQKVDNEEKQRVKRIYSAINKQHNPTSPIGLRNSDSANYYSQILKGPDQFDIIGKTVLPGDSIAGALDSVTAALDFPNYLLVIYTRKLVPPEYRLQYPDAGSAMASQMTLLNNNSLAIQANGSYYNPTDLLHFGYWGWAEKMATMLPFDYQPPRVKK